MKNLAAAALVLIIVSAGCNFAGGGGSEMTYEQAASGLKTLIDEAMVAGFAGTPLPPPEPVFEDFCVDSRGVVNDEVHPYYDYFFPIRLLGDDPDAFVFRAAESLAAAGLRVTESDSSGAIRRFATNVKLRPGSLGQP